MDKHEFNIKVDQIKKMVSKGDFETAMKIADTIDWRRVRNANLLSMISSVYEKNAEYQEAKDILLIAFERAPIGKRLLYKLTQLALKEGDITEAESYYREFCDLAGDDSRQDILRYLILKAKGAPVEQLIHTLESYTSIELDEKWLYELAELYHQAGNADDCVKTCDKIMLLFGLGQYVDKAMELKLQYAPLTKYQMDLVENRDKYEEKLRQVEQNGVSALAPKEETVSREEEEMAAAARRDQVAAAYANPPSEPVYPSYTEAPSEPSYPNYTEAPSESAYQNHAESPLNPAYARGEEQAREESAVSNIEASFAAAAAKPQGPTTSVSPEESLEVSMKEAEAEASLAEEMSKISMDSYSEEPVKEKTRVLANVKDLKKAGEQPEKTKVLDEIRHIQAAKPAEDAAAAREPAKPQAFPAHLMVESRIAQEGLEVAVEALKKAHVILSYKHPAAKISGEKLNQRGILASASKLEGKDLIVENAGDLSDAMLEELDKFLAEDKTGILVVLVDSPRQMEGIRRISPSLAERFQVVTSVSEAERYFFIRAKKLNQNRKPESEPVQPSAVRREERPVRPAVVQGGAEAVRSSAVQRESQAVHPSAVQRESQAVRPSAAQREAEAARLSAAQREMEAASSNAVKTAKTSADLEAPVSGDTRVFSRVETSRVKAAQTQNPRKEAAQPIRQAEIHTADKPQAEISRAEVSRAETAASSNIVQMRTPQASFADEPSFAEQEKSRVEEPDDDRIMDVDEFAQYCCHYASQIDCNISRKSMLALYERVEIMEEDGIALTKTAAEDLIEEAADRAEKPSLGKRITGLFSSKYDKEGLLILKEEHFMS